MAIHNANPVMKWVAGVVAVGGIGYLLIPSSSGPDLAGSERADSTNTATVRHPNVGVGGESNTTEEVLNRLLGEMELMKKERDRERGENRNRLEALQKQLDATKQQQTSGMPMIPGAEDSPMLKRLQSEIDGLRAMMGNNQGDNKDDGSYDIGVNNDEYPVGMDNSGIPSLSNPYGRQNGQVAPPIEEDNGGWIEPMDMSATTNERGEEIFTLPELSANPMFDNPIRRTQNAVNRQLGTPGKGDKDGENLIPVYTIPADGTLVKAVTRTALLGRIPIEGTVTDPYRFKLIVGSENLASNGHRIPGLHGMTISGVARGDYTLKCVSGDITSITYTFVDGTIRTVQSESGGDGRDGRLGYIADEQGVPCIGGEFISNAPEYLSQSIAADVFAAAAGAFADQEKVFNTNAEGTTTSQVTGDPWINMGGEGLKAGANTASDWVKKRQQSAFDAIYTPTGITVEVHMEKQIDIDYDTNGRKVAHHATSSYGSNRGLD